MGVTSLKCSQHSRKKILFTLSKSRYKNIFYFHVEMLFIFCSLGVGKWAWLYFVRLRTRKKILPVDIRKKICVFVFRESCAKSKGSRRDFLAVFTLKIRRRNFL